MPTLTEKLAILADAAKYDASCASSGGVKRNSLGGKGVGSTTGAGICHAYAPDGRCISLLKILMTNFCIFDCAYCVNRASSNVKRARFSVEEVVALTLDFYKRNYIEGLFLSSGIIRSPNDTMEAMARIAKTLRVEHDFRGYIHLKSIPEADQRLIEEAGRYADRLSINVELPSAESLSKLAPQKRQDQIRKSMGRLRLAIDEHREERKKSRKAPVFAPAGQSTQVIVGADSARDMDILSMSETLYASFGLRRVYYSAFSPIPDASKALPPVAPPLAREHRLYQADWLIRNYGFALDEIKTGAADVLDLKIDPKLAWALANRDRFPVDVNLAPREALLRVPGLGARVVDRIIRTRRSQALRLVDLGRLVQSLDKVRPFIVAADWRPGALLDSDRLRDKLVHAPQQLDLFAA
ncbi:putative DNA modification/repair radical SAM protein [Methylocystis parvus]|uniref:putative DNA modification/repair radical SAM protein n=1 Tax=Methylocystis parvus TaxID=134 RepID=UPI003C719ACF